QGLSHTHDALRDRDVTRTRQQRRARADDEVRPVHAGIEGRGRLGRDERNRLALTCVRRGAGGEHPDAAPERQADGVPRVRAQRTSPTTITTNARPATAAAGSPSRAKATSGKASRTLYSGSAKIKCRASGDVVDLSVASMNATAGTTITQAISNAPARLRRTSSAAPAAARTSRQSDQTCWCELKSPATDER